MLTLTHWLARWPLGLLHALGGWLGWVVYAASPGYRRRLRHNAGCAGISLSDRRRAVAEAGRLVLELPRVWLGRAPGPARLADDAHGVPVCWQPGALERIQAALEPGRGLLAFTPHLGCFDMAAQAYAARFGAQAPVTVMYRPARQAWLRELQARSRDRAGLKAVPASLAGVRQMLRALRRGEAVGLLPDQVPPQGQGEWAPFFGQPAYTMTLAGRLAAQTRAELLLMWGERLPGGQGFRIHAEPFPDAAVLREGEPRRAAEAVNRAMEDLIRRQPGQYLWGYDRYKAPRGAPAPPSSSIEPGGEA